MDYYLAGGTTSTLADTPNYAEYRYFKPNFDEELQVWSWTNSFTTQYRDVTNSGTAPLHQAWSFGGNYTSVANMPTLNANVNYNGSWTATAQTSNWVNDTTNPAQTVDFNNNWQVRGTSALVANFGTSAFTGTLQSTSWVGKSIAGSSWITVNALVPSANRLDPVMTADVKLTGQITTSTAAGAHPNQINGTANMDNTTYGWITTAGSNPMYGGFFSPVGIPPGSNPTEVAGVFALDTAIPAPVGGNYAINDDRRGFLSMSGMFHGTNP